MTIKKNQKIDEKIEEFEWNTVIKRLKKNKKNS